MPNCLYLKLEDQLLDIDAYQGKPECVYDDKDALAYQRLELHKRFFSKVRYISSVLFGVDLCLYSLESILTEFIPSLKGMTAFDSNVLEYGMLAFGFAAVASHIAQQCSRTDMNDILELGEQRLLKLPDEAKLKFLSDKSQ
ncbi:hypothetical protein KY330_04245 [Candidatus Woesearchaeota archaeon]|nr:hypothetical protein [Candidatus Woesearchaeota archaeon]